MADPSIYRSLVGALQYLTFTLPDIAYVVQQIFLFMHAPKLPHLNALKHIIQYVNGTPDHGLMLYSSPTTKLVSYDDVDWGVAQTIDARHLDIVFFSTTISSPGLSSDKRLFLVQALK